MKLNIYISFVLRTYYFVNTFNDLATLIILLLF